MPTKASMGSHVVENWNRLTGEIVALFDFFKQVKPQVAYA